MINVTVVYCQVRSSTVNTQAMLRPTSGVAATRTQLQGTCCTTMLSDVTIRNQEITAVLNSLCYKNLISQPSPCKTTI